MPTLIKSLILALLLLSVSSCTNSRQFLNWWNGIPSGPEADRARDAVKESNAYYASKSPEWIAQYKKNIQICDSKRNSVSNMDEEEIRANNIAYIQCMEERGTPVFLYKG